MKLTRKMSGDDMINWDDFVLVDTIDFKDGEDEGLLPPTEEHEMLEDKCGDHANKKIKKETMSPPVDLDQHPKYKNFLENVLSRIKCVISEEEICRRIDGPKEAFEFQIGGDVMVPYPPPPPPKHKPGVLPLPPPSGVNPNHQHELVVTTYERIRNLWEMSGPFIP